MTQLAHELGDNDRARVRLATQSSRKLYRPAEEIVVIRYRLTGVDADTHFQLLSRAVAVSKNVPLDVGRGLYRVSHLVEGSHYSVAGVLDLSPAMGCEPAPDEAVVHADYIKCRSVAEPGRHLGRADDVGEHDGAQAASRLRASGARSRFGIADAAEECLDRGEIHCDDVGRNFAMRLAMDLLGGCRVRRVDQTEAGAAALVEPVSHVPDVVLVLYCEVFAVRLG